MDNKVGHQPEDKKWYKKWWGILLIILSIPTFTFPIVLIIILLPNKKVPSLAKIAVFLFIVFVAIGVISTNNPRYTQTKSVQKKATQAEFEIKIAGNTYADVNNRLLTFIVKNVGQTEVWPACHIEVSSPDKKYYAQDYITWNTPLAPGNKKYFEGLMPVNNGGTFATHSEVNCSTDPLH